MPRRREIAKREIPADPIYNSQLVTKFISTIMKAGKRSTAERIMYKAMDIVKEKTADDPLKTFKKAIENVKPSLEVKSRRVGGKTMQEKLANEFMDAANLRGGAVKKREDTHRMAEANKAFAHYRW